MGHPGSPSLLVGVEGGCVVNRPGILAAAGAGGQATHHHIRGLIEGLGRDRGWIGDIPEAHLSSQGNRR